MKNFLKVVKPVCAILFFISIAYIFYYKSFTDKTGGSTLNNETKIIDGRYYLADNKGNTKEIIVIEKANKLNKILKGILSPIEPNTTADKHPIILYIVPVICK